MKDEKNSLNSPTESGIDQEIHYVPVEYLHSIPVKNDDTTLLDLVIVLWEGRKTLLAFLIAFTLVGLFNYLFGPVVYESESIFIQESPNQSPTQQLLMGLGGAIGLSERSDELIPSRLYPQIVQSAQFQYELLYEEVEFEKLGIHTTLYDYFDNHYRPSGTEIVKKGLLAITLQLPSNLYKGVRGIIRWMANGFSSPVSSSQLQVYDEETFLFLNSKERRLINELRDKVSIELSEGLISIRTELPDPKAAAELNRLVVDKIQQYVTDYRLEKARQNLTFVEKQQEEAREQYNQAQMELASFLDKNVSLSSARAQTQLEDLQNRRNLTFNVFNTISQQVEQAKLKIQEDTPVFNVLQRPRIPDSSRGGSTVLLIVTILSGVIIGIIWIFSRFVIDVARDHILREESLKGKR